MISNISFGSTYKVSNKLNTSDAFSQFESLAMEIGPKQGVKIKCDDEYIAKDGHTGSIKDFKTIYTIVAPDVLDDEIETYCANFGISYSKFETNDILKAKKIKSRIIAPQKGMKKVYINYKKLEELAQNQQSNIDNCKDDYYIHYYSKIDYMLKSADKIPAASLYITPIESDINDTLDCIEKFGADELDDKQLRIDFRQETNDPDHCMCFAMSDLGIRNIPVYMNEDTYKLANALGIVCKN